MEDSELKWSKMALLRWRTKRPKPKYVSLCPIPLLFGNFLKQHAQVMYGLTNLSFLKQANIMGYRFFFLKLKFTVFTGNVEFILIGVILQFHILLQSKRHHRKETADKHKKLGKILAPSWEEHSLSN